MIIDVSEHQKSIDWGKAASKIEAAILRCGYGTDLQSQDDKYWQENVTKCEQLGIPYGVYLYSYSTNEGRAKSEAEHAIRLLQGHKPTLPVFIDLEQKGTQNYSKQAAAIFCETIKAAGYQAGIYCSENWWNNYIKDFPSEYSRWIAKYGSNNGAAQTKPNVENVYLWQFTSKGSVDGINGKVDCNLLQSASEVPKTKTVAEIAQEVINNQWGSGEDRKNRLQAAGYSYETVQAEVNKILGVNNVKAHPYWTQLTVDGLLGPATIKRSQEFFSTPQDGKISKPSLMVKALQKWLGGVTTDGYLGPKTIKRWQVIMGTPADGVISKPSALIRAWQTHLNGHYKA